MNINYFDVITLCLLSFFAIRGIMSGFVAEILGLVAIFGGLFLANNFYIELATYIDFISNSLVKNLIAFIAIFIATNIVVAIACHILQKITNLCFIGWIDALGGFVAGLVKGVLLCAVILALINMFTPNSEFIEQSYVVPYLYTVLTYINEFIPLDILKEIKI